MSQEVNEVFEWSGKQTSEAHAFKLADYYWTDPIKIVLFRLTNADRGLLGIQGLQGTGKSAALEALAQTLENDDRLVIKYKWKRDWKKQFFEELCMGDNYWFILWQKVLNVEGLIEKTLHVSREIVKNYLIEWKHADNTKPQISDDELSDALHGFENVPSSQKTQWHDRLDNIADLEKLEGLVGTKVVEKVKESMTENFLNRAHVIFIDMPDYNKTNLQLMNKDIDELQHMWNEFMERDSKVSFVVSIQKEIVMRKPHFFFGKVKWVNLKPLTKEQLLEAYRQKWQTFEPFTEESLRLIAKLSRGVFRRFLSYVNLSIERFQMLCPSSSGLITVEDVEAAISFEVLLGDLELELADIFSNGQQRLQAVKVLNLLRKNDLSQKQIAEKLDISEATSGKLVSKLELYNYVKRTRSKKGSGWIVSLV